MYIFLLLQVIHEDSQPSEIVFTIKTPPSFGLILRIPTDKRQLHQVQYKFTLWVRKQI